MDKQPGILWDRTEPRVVRQEAAARRSLEANTEGLTAWVFRVMESSLGDFESGLLRLRTVLCIRLRDRRFSNHALETVSVIVPAADCCTQFVRRNPKATFRTPDR
jgi:hypothetical protein